MWDRPFPPGQHGRKNTRRKKMSEFKRQLVEKQKLRANYGLNERQFMRLFKLAVKSHEPAGEKLAQLLERRLDNVVFRSGFANTIPAARQLVTHGHVTVNGKLVDIPSFTVDVNDVIGINEKSKALVVVESALQDVRLERPSWFEFDEQKRETTIKEMPRQDSVPFPVEMDLVVEYYSKRL